MTGALRFLDRALPPESSRRAAATSAAAILVMVLVLRLALAGPPPGGVVVRGMLTGCAQAILVVALLLVYRSTGIVNFAQTALGGAGAYLCFVLVEFFGLPFLVVFPLALAVGGLAGFLVNAVFVQRFFNEPRLVLTVVTIVVADFLGDSRDYVNAIPGISSATHRLTSVEALRGGKMSLPFEGWTFRLAPFTFGFGALFTVALTVLVLAAFAIFLRRSRLGTGIRGAAENAERAQSLGIDVRLLSAVVWTIAGVFAGAAALLTTVNSGVGAGGLSLGSALAAVVLARLRSMPVAVVAAFAISVAQEAVLWFHPTTAVIDLLLFGVIAGGLLLSRQRSTRSEAGSDASSWKATKEIRPVPRELEVVPGVRRARRGLIVAAVVVALVLPFTLPNSQTNLASLIFIQAIVGLSLVVLTGWSGQISLGQFALVAVAAVFAANLTSVRGLSFWLALPAVTALTAALAALLGAPALRLRGPFLAVVTLAFAALTRQTLFDSGIFGGLIPDRVHRPSMVFVSFASERAYYFLCLAALVVVAFVAARLRRSRPGRILIGARDNAAGIESFGIPLVRSRIAGFALSGAMCGVAGVLFVHHQRSVDPESYASGASIEMFIMAMLGGITSVPGALLGAAYVGVANFLFPTGMVRTLATSGGLLLLLVVAPGGLSAIAAGARDAVLRIVATRRQIPVPSLFADMDYEAALAQRAPLVEPIPFRGLEAIPQTRRYRRYSARHDPMGAR